MDHKKAIELLNEALKPTEVQKIYAERRRAFYFGYITAKGWSRDPNELTREQVLEIYNAQNQETFEI